MKQFLIDLGGIGDVEQQPHEDDEQSHSSGGEDSEDAMNPQGDDPGSANVREVKAARIRRPKTPQPETKPKSLVACHVSAQGFAYLAIDSNKIIVYNLATKEVQSIFESYQCQTVIYLTSIDTERADYLVVVTRTSCVLYSLHEDGVRRMTSYLINSRKRPYRTIEENRFSYQVRFYFTSAKVVRAKEEDPATEQDSLGKDGGKAPGFGLLGPDYTLNHAGFEAALSDAQDWLAGDLRTFDNMANDDVS